MSILSQIIVICLILFTAVILIYANKGLASAAEEGEHFVDEWALRQERKEAIRIRKRGSRRGDFLSEEEADYDGESDEVFFDEYEEDYGEEYYGEEYEEDSYEEYDEDIPDFPGRNSYEEYERNSLSEYGERESSHVDPFDLILFDEDGQVMRTVRVDHFPFTLGRGRENHLVLNDLSVAMKHASIVCRYGMPVLVDAGTANQIYAEGQIVREYPLKDGGRFYIGNYELQVQRKKEGDKSNQTAYRSPATIIALKREKVVS